MCLQSVWHMGSGHYDNALYIRPMIMPCISGLNYQNIFMLTKYKIYQVHSLDETFVQRFILSHSEEWSRKEFYG